MFIHVWVVASNFGSFSYICPARMTMQTSAVSAHLFMQDFADLVEHCEILRPFQQIAKIAKLIHEKVLSESEYQAVRKGAYLVDLEEAVTMQWSARQVFQPLYGSTPALGSST